jgi:hypothetical protein
MVKKITSVSLALAIVLTMFGASASYTHATNSPSWHWGEYQISQFVSAFMAVDDRCSNPDRPFVVTIFERPDYTGNRARICGRWDDLSQLPQYKGAGAPNFNNAVSSIWVKELNTDAVEFHILKDQDGRAWGFGSIGKFRIDEEFDNNFSSVRKRVY